MKQEPCQKNGSLEQQYLHQRNRKDPLNGALVPKQPSAQVQPTQLFTAFYAKIAAGNIAQRIAARGITAHDVTSHLIKIRRLANKFTDANQETSEYAILKGIAKTSEAEHLPENASPTSEDVSPKAYHCQRHNGTSMIQDAEMKGSKGAKKHISKSETKANMTSPPQSIHAATIQRRDNALDESHAMKKFEYSRRRKP
jgi:hypothetical protein